MTDIRRRVLTATGITAFQRRVYLALLDVEPGQTVTYSELAAMIGCRSARAVGQALRRNPFAPDVPCHRVVAKHGLGGYFGQTDGEMLERKRRLLREESDGLNSEPFLPNPLSADANAHERTVK